MKLHGCARLSGSSLIIYDMRVFFPRCASKVYFTMTVSLRCYSTELLDFALCNNQIALVLRLTGVFAGRTFQKMYFTITASRFCYIYEAAHDKTYIKTCATSEDSDQPAHPHSLIRVFASCMCLLQCSGCPKRDIWESVPYREIVQVDLSLCW